jgi:hypothetical protein
MFGFYCTPFLSDRHFANDQSIEFRPTVISKNGLIMPFTCGAINLETVRQLRVAPLWYRLPGLLVRLH